MLFIQCIFSPQNIFKLIRRMECKTKKLIGCFFFSSSTFDLIVTRNCCCGWWWCNCICCNDFAVRKICNDYCIEHRWINNDYVCHWLLHAWIRYDWLGKFLIKMFSLIGNRTKFMFTFCIIIDKSFYWIDWIQIYNINSMNCTDITHESESGSTTMLGRFIDIRVSRGNCF